MDVYVILAVADARPDGRVARLEAVDQVLGAEPGGFGVHFQAHPERLVSDDVVHHLRFQPGDVLERRENGLAALLRFCEARLVIHREPALDGGDRANHLLPIHFVRPADAAYAPPFVAHERLIAQLADHVLRAERQPGGLRRAHVLGGDALEIRPHADVLAEVLQRVYLPRRVHRDHDPVGARYLDAVFERQDVRVEILLHRVEVDGGGVRSDGVFEVFARRPVVGAELDQLRAGRFKTAVVPVSLAALNQKLVLHAGGVGQLLDFVVVVPRHDRRRRERERRPRAGGYPRRRHARHVRHGAPRLLLQLHQRDVRHARRLHRLAHLRNRRRAAEHRHAADGVYHRLGVQLLIYLSPIRACHIQNLLHGESRLFCSPIVYTVRARRGIVVGREMREK